MNLTDKFEKEQLDEELNKELIRSDQMSVLFATMRSWLEFVTLLDQEQIELYRDDLSTVASIQSKILKSLLGE